MSDLLEKKIIFNQNKLNPKRNQRLNQKFRQFWFIKRLVKEMTEGTELYFI